MSTSKKVKSQTYDTGLYGSATTGSSGTTYNPTAFEKNLVQMSARYMPQYLQQMAAPTYDSEIFKAQTAQRNRLANQSFENNLINPMASRGLTRGSSINQMSNQFAQKLADMENDAMATEDTRTANVLNNLATYYQLPYNMMSNASDYSNNMYTKAMNTTGTSRGNTGSMLGSLAGMGIGSMAGNPWVGSQLGGAVGSLFDK